MDETFEKRASLMLTLLYFGVLGTFWYNLKKRQFIMSTLAHSEIFKDCSRLITRQFPLEKNLIINETSIGGQTDQNFNLMIQFTSNKQSGVGKFTGTIENLHHKFTEAVLEVHSNGKTETISLPLNQSG
jgi:hypothetical protein